MGFSFFSLGVFMPAGGRYLGYYVKRTLSLYGGSPFHIQLTPEPALERPHGVWIIFFFILLALHTLRMSDIPVLHLKESLEKVRT